MLGDDPMRRLRHDLRTAFNELRLCVEVLRIENDPAEIARWLELIEGAAEGAVRRGGILLQTATRAKPDSLGRRR